MNRGSSRRRQQAKAQSVQVQECKSVRTPERRNRGNTEIAETQKSQNHRNRGITESQSYKNTKKGAYSAPKNNSLNNITASMRIDSSMSYVSAWRGIPFPVPRKKNTPGICCSKKEKSSAIITGFLSST